MHLNFLVSTEVSDLDAFMFTYNFLDQSNQKIIQDNDVTKELYIKRVLANAVWRDKSFREMCKILLGRPRGHDEYRSRLRLLYPHGIKNGYTLCIDLVQKSFPDAKYLFGITSLNQCKQLINQMNRVNDIRFLEVEDLINTYAEVSQRIDFDPVT